MLASDFVVNHKNSTWVKKKGHSLRCKAPGSVITHGKMQDGEIQMSDFGT